MRTAPFRSRALGAGLLLLAALAAACSSGDQPPPEATPDLEAAPASATPEAAQAAETRAPATASPGPTLAEIRAVALAGAPEVVEAVESGDVEALLALTFRHLGFCGWPVRDAEAPIPPETAHAARNACNPDVAYRGIDFDGRLHEDFDGGLDRVGGLWAEEPAREALQQAFVASARLREVEVQPYRRVLADGTIVDQERYALTFEFIGATGLNGRNRVGEIVPVNGLAIEVEAGEAQPITQLGFVHRDEWPITLIEHEPPPLRVTADVGPSVRAALADVEGVPDVLAAVDRADVDALLSLFESQTLNCAHPPLPGKELPELCELIGNPPGDRYESVIDTTFGLTGFVSIERARFTLGALLAESTPMLEAAWRLSRQWDGAEEFSDRYLVAFAGLPLNVAPRGDTLGHAFGWDSFLLLVEPRVERPIIWYSLHNADWTPGDSVGQYAGSSDPVKYPLPERIR